MQRFRRGIVFCLIIILLIAGGRSPAEAYAPPGQPQPFGLPFAEPAGPGTWLLVQPYGNTVSAFGQRGTTYRAGQGLHFGIDLSARCGYPIVAIGDGVVAKVDASEHGSAPHNLMIDHANGYASFYGHLFERPSLNPGDPIQRGQVIAKVGDPDESCTSRPHLHLEIRNAGFYNRAYNPIALIDADWDSLALSGVSSPGFARDLSDPRRWQTLSDQPEVQFWGALLNDFQSSYPPDWRR